MHSFWGVPSGDGLCAAGAGAVSAREKGGHGDSACWPVSLRGRPRPRVGNVEPGADSSLPLNDTDDHSHYPEPPVPHPPRPSTLERAGLPGPASPSPTWPVTPPWPPAGGGQVAFLLGRAPREQAGQAETRGAVGWLSHRVRL